jgi:hypothetical protein
MSLFAFSVGCTTSLSFFKLVVEDEAIFMLSRAWATTDLLDESKINCTLIKGNGGRDEMRDGTDVCVSVSVRLAGLTVCVEGLVNSGGQ